MPSSSQDAPAIAREELDSRVRIVSRDPGEPSADREAPDIVPWLPARYALKLYLDRGATSDVYLASDRELGTEVVIKILNQKSAETPELLDRFLLGAEAAMRIQHPGVVKVFFAEAPAFGRPYSVMEHLAGRTLGDVLRSGRRFSESVALGICRDLADGLHAVHQAGVVHRDVKPDNIFLLGPAENPLGTKILDFGLAQCDPRREENVVLGTGQYMAPEQVLGDTVDARCDIYALGVVMFRLFTGHLPWDLELGLDLLRHQLISPAPPPSWLEDQINPSVERLILRALRKNPDNRYSSMAELKHELERIAGQCEPESALSACFGLPDRYIPKTPHARQNAKLLNVDLGPG